MDIMITEQKKRTFRFEIQACINVEVAADNRDEARQYLVNHIENYTDELASDPCISNGVEVK